MSGKRLRITGIVQGVGFRPFIYRLAREYALQGEVWNSAAGVDVILQGGSRQIELFIADLPLKQPPQADIRSIDVEAVNGLVYHDFSIRKSEHHAGRGALAPPDLATCADCQRELADPGDRRYRYPFTNCVNCGPRFTIIKSLPYDRPATTMSDFIFCKECSAEYEDPGARRFHAQPNACPVCGPEVYLTVGNGTVVSGEKAMKDATAVLADGGILAVKSLGGYHLACDASSGKAVSRLRKAKERPGKPFAVMAGSIDSLLNVVRLRGDEKKLLLSSQAPIVLVEKKDPNGSLPGICSAVAPGRSRLGVFLPYTPLHRLLFDDSGIPFMVMTSGNRKDEPISVSPAEAEHNLSGVADVFLHHDRPIHCRCDDSVTVVLNRGPIVFRRARGYVPRSIKIPSCRKPVLAMGGDLKSSFCLAAGTQAFVSQYLGDMEEEGVQELFRVQVAHFMDLCRIEPAAVIHDLHPGYFTTRLASELAGTMGGLPLVAVQHHQAHVAAVMAEHGLEGPVIGLAFDGAGYGLDGTVWGGEVLVAGRASFRRVGHLRPVVQPGGDVASRECWRMALSYVMDAFGGEMPEDLQQIISLGVEREMVEVVRRMVLAGFNSPFTSSCGRLFDAVAGLTGVCSRQTYEGEAACLLEAAVCGEILSVGETYPITLQEDYGKVVLDTRPMIRAIVNDLRAGKVSSEIARSFHRYLVAAAVILCERIREMTGINRVVLSGGVFQNLLLARTLPDGLEQNGFTVYLHGTLPPNDGCISLGQVLVAANTAVLCGLRG